MNQLFNEDWLVSSPAYGETMNGTVLPWLAEREKVMLLNGFEDRPLYCVSYEAEEPVATVLILHGFTENAYKYAELIFSLLNLHFSVVAYDQRGHGRSGRDDGVPDPSVTHVDHFSDYVKDLRIVCDHFKRSDNLPFFLFAHSMGGAVASLFLEQYPGVFDAAVLSSPMIAPHTGGLPFSVSTAVSRLGCLFGKGKNNPFFMKRYTGPEDFATSCAADPNRFAWYDKIKASRTDFQNSVPSWRWVNESLHVTEQILAAGAPEKVSCPVLLCAADIDFSVLPEPQKTFIARVPSGRFLFVKDSRHEIFRSANEVLFPWWRTVLDFYTALIPSPEGNGGN